MGIPLVIMTLCAAGVAFYLRFLAALCKECQPRWMNYRQSSLLRLGKRFGAQPLRSKTNPLVAVQITYVLRSTNFQELRRDSI